MTDCKKLKDPIYGYISIESSVVDGIIDTAEFQRLRSIIQTSYSPLYSSAVHNRFVHSLGVYYLGSIVADSLSRNSPIIDDLNLEEFERYLYIFKLACLLHDLGHAPFSHTGEEFYLDNGSRTHLHDEIVILTKDEDLLGEIASKNFKAAAHELMSVIVSLRVFEAFFRYDEERSLFARCILGYPYFVKCDTKHSILNCLISLLNSTVIDVDKLDYLIRDAYITGFDTVCIDYERLLTSIQMVRGEDNLYKLIYKKGAVSVIENVVYAHDAERKWIQTHPVVQYEAYLLQTIMQLIVEKYTDVNIFSYDSLSVKGIALTEGYRVSLISDADIIFLMKNIKDNAIVDEYLCRKKRRHPLWKSESEYKAYFSQGFKEEDFDKVERGLDNVCRLCKSRIINVDALKRCEKDVEDTLSLIHNQPNNRELLEKLVQQKEQNIKWIKAIEEFASEQEIPFDFVVLSMKQFNSGFTKSEFEEIEIGFDILKKPCFFKKVTNVLNASKSDREHFFYLYYRENSKGKTIDLSSLACKWGDIAISERKYEMKDSFQ